MKYKIEKDKIVVFDVQDFNINQTLECGQVFRYEIDNGQAKIISLNHMAIIKSYPSKLEIYTKDTDYFVRYFDLNTDYSYIKNELCKDSILAPCIKFGYGIRILKQDLFETLVSFIISANNNIKRIQNSLNKLSQMFGKDMGEYYAFPEFEELKKAKIEDFVLAGLGYRAEQLFYTLQHLDINELYGIKSLDFDSQHKYLLSLKGVGEKVCNCIMLFALGNQNSFPVDTWINKVYNDITKTTCTNRKLIQKELVEKYKNLSGYAQQYFFYYYRENYKKL